MLRDLAGICLCTVECLGRFRKGGQKWIFLSVTVSWKICAPRKANGDTGKGIWHGYRGFVEGSLGGSPPRLGLAVDCPLVSRRD